MTDLNRNTRTLIVSFVIAIFALVPLRFVEIGQQMAGFSSATVLGTQQDYGWEEGAMNEYEYGYEEDYLMYEQEARLEAPYDKIEASVLGVSTEEVMPVEEMQSEEVQIVETEGVTMEETVAAVDVSQEWVEEEPNCIDEAEAGLIIEEMFNSGASSEDMQLVANSVCRL